MGSAKVSKFRRQIVFMTHEMKTQSSKTKELRDIRGYFDRPMRLKYENCFFHQFLLNSLLAQSVNVWY